MEEYGFGIKMKLSYDKLSKTADKYVSVKGD